MISALKVIPLTIGTLENTQNRRKESAHVRSACRDFRQMCAAARGCGFVDRMESTDAGFLSEMTHARGRAPEKAQRRQSASRMVSLGFPPGPSLDITPCVLVTARSVPAGMRSRGPGCLLISRSWPLSLSRQTYVLPRDFPTQGRAVCSRSSARSTDSASCTCASEPRGPGCPLPPPRGVSTARKVSLLLERTSRALRLRWS